MEKFLKGHPGKGANPTPHLDELQGSKAPNNPDKGGGKVGGNLGALNKVKREAGVPSLFYCKPVNDKGGGACQSSDSDHCSGCMLQLKRQQLTKNGKSVNHQDPFRFTITCKVCRKRPPYEDECHIKRRESGKPRHQEAERQTNQKHPPIPPRMATRVVKGEEEGVARMEPPTITPRGDRQRPPLLLFSPLLIVRSVRREKMPPQRSVTPRRGDCPGLQIHSWLQGWT